MKEYNYLLKSFDIFGNETFTASYVHREDAINGIEAYQKSIPYRQKVIMYEIKHWVSE